MSEFPDLVIAIDGGQSSTLALAATTDGHILGTGTAGPSNHVHEPGGPERLRGAVTGSIRQSLESAGLPEARVISVCAGMTGGVELARVVLDEMFPGAVIQVYYDYVTALAGASLAQPGIVVIAGTGAVAYGRLADRREAIAGGWGYIMGDEGSGYDIGRSALQAASQAVDGRGAMTTLVEMLPAQTGLADMRAVHRAVYSSELSRPQIARLSISVVNAAQSGDNVALALLDKAGEHLAQAALAAAVRLDVAGSGIDVFPTGGIFQSGDIINRAFRQHLAAVAPQVRVKPPSFPPVIGSLLLALQRTSAAIDSELINIIRTTLPQHASTKNQSGEL